MRSFVVRSESVHVIIVSVTRLCGIVTIAVNCICIVSILMKMIQM